MFDKVVGTSPSLAGLSGRKAQTGSSPIRASRRPGREPQLRRDRGHVCLLRFLGS